MTHTVSGPSVPFNLGGRASAVTAGGMSISLAEKFPSLRVEAVTSSAACTTERARCIERPSGSFYTDCSTLTSLSYSPLSFGD
jgi:hypothetical protein